MKRQSEFGEPCLSPGGTQTRSRIKSGKLSEQHLTVTPGGVTQVWHDRTPNDEKPEERKARKTGNKSSTQAARRCKTRASVAPDVHDAELAMRREIRASAAPEVHDAELAARREIRASAAPEVHNAELTARREIRASVAPEVHDAELAARRAAYKNEPLEIRAAKLQKRRENRPQIQVRLICSNFSVSEYNIFFAFLATLASKEY
jgi:hypothetical protein